MLAFKVNNEWLELNPGSVLDMELSNQYLQFDSDTILGEYSYPLDIPASAKNMRLLNYAGLFQARVNIDGAEAQCFDDQTQHSTGKLKIQKVNIDLNNPENGTISVAYFTGVSWFYQDLKDKKLRDADYGGDRTFNWDNYQRNGTGFWGHIHQVLDAAPGYGVSNFDYAFFTVINQNFRWDSWGSNWINSTSINPFGQLAFNPGGQYLDADGKVDGAVIVPYAYLKYVLLRMMNYLGWKLKGDILDDADFKKVTLDNARAIDWCYYQPHKAANTQDIPARPQIVFNLQDHVPDVTIAAFLLAIRTRMGWWYDVDRINKIVTIQQLNKVAANGTKDFTTKSNPLPSKTILDAQKIYSLKTSNGITIDFSGVTNKGLVNKFSDLPAPLQALDQQVYLVVNENNYYICQNNPDTNHWEWQLWESNVADVVPANATDEITTAAETAPLEKQSDGVHVYLAPRIDSAGYWAGRSSDDGQSNTIILLFYHGIRNTTTGYPYPFGSHHIYDANGNQVGNWSLSFQAYKNDGTPTGLYDLDWLPFLKKIQAIEQINATLYLSREEFMNLKFSDELVIAGVKMYISKIKPTLPYQGSVQIEASRI